MDNNEEIKSLKNAINELNGKIHKLEIEIKAIKNYMDVYDLPNQSTSTTADYREISQPKEPLDNNISQNILSEQPVSNAVPIQTKAAQPPKKQNVEFAIGSTWFNRIGIILMILGIGFFLKYSFDNHWIGVIGRISMGYIASVAFLIAGEWLSRKEKYRNFALGFTGGGITVVYLTTFAAIHFYNLLHLRYSYSQL
jgi:uncharacterized membrane protein